MDSWSFSTNAASFSLQRCVGQCRPKGQEASAGQWQWQWQSTSQRQAGTCLPRSLHSTALPAPRTRHSPDGSWRVARSSTHLFSLIFLSLTLL